MRSIQSTLFSLLAASGAAYAETTLNLTPGVSPISHDVYDLHMTVFWICVVIGIVVFGAMFYSMIHHRKSKGAKAAEFHSHPWLEIGWTIVPVLILVVMAVPATRVLLNMNNEDPEALTIKVTGYQWKWHYEYLEEGVSFFSNLSTPYEQLHNQAPKGEFYLREVDHPLVIPIHKKIRFLITSNDVNHAWWVPDFAVKRDAISGFINEAWAVIDKPGIYRGQCAELCGINHAYMPIVVIATTEQGYKDWIAKQKGEATQGESETLREWTMKELLAQGEKVYDRICVACHQPGGVGLPPTFPALKGGPIPTGPISNHIDIVFNGKSGTAMQAFKGQLNDVELASVITYERNAFGNNKGDLVQPIQIKALRDGKTMAEALMVKPEVQGATKPASAGKPASGEKPETQAKTEAPNALSKPEPSTPNAAQAPSNEPPSEKSAVPAVENQPSSVKDTMSQPKSDGESKPAPTVGATPADDLKAAMVRGEKVYLSTCAVCHQPAGTGMPPTFPALKGNAITTGPVAAHINTVLNGKPGTAMVAFKDQLKDQELADVITYERNAWGNNTGNLVTPAEIQTARQQPAQNNKPQGAQ